jgi:hypothetical protein
MMRSFVMSLCSDVLSIVMSYIVLSAYSDVLSVVMSVYSDVYL